MVSTVNMATAANSHYRPDIDGLRAVAVGAVIMNHFNHDSLPSGYLGVDIFFVISGFVITASLLNRPSQSLGSLLSSFYSRRVKRLIRWRDQCSDLPLQSRAIRLLGNGAGRSFWDVQSLPA
jgi:Acyltransferase family